MVYGGYGVELAHLDSGNDAISIDQFRHIRLYPRQASWRILSVLKKTDNLGRMLLLNTSVFSPGSDPICTGVLALVALECSREDGFTVLRWNIRLSTVELNRW